MNNTWNKRKQRENWIFSLRLALIWMAIGAFQAIYEYVILSNHRTDPDLRKFEALLLSNMLLAFLAGLLAGHLLFTRINRWLRTHSYRRALLLLWLSISGIYLLLSTLGSFLYNSTKLGLSAFDPAVIPWVTEYLQGPENIKNYLFWTSVGLMTVFLIQVSDKYGPGNLTNFLLGRYFRPRREDRAFMFMDLRSSTTIAEQLGELLFFEFIRDFIRDTTPAILRCRGEIYNYLGDEILITWSMENALSHNNCVEVFFAARRDLEARRHRYESKYGLMPVFKAGLHCGQVVCGEIGLVKRDIAYSGDVLNTAARIQSMCNELGQDLLVSEKIYRKLKRNRYPARAIGEVSLKGKAHPLTLFAIGPPIKQEQPAPVE